MRVIVIALAFILSALSQGRATTPALSLASATARPILWEVSDSDSRVWMLGSVHALPREVEWRTPKIDELIRTSPIVYFETDVDKTAYRSISDAWLRYSNDRRVIDLSYKLKPGSWRKLEKVVEEEGLNLADFYFVQPWYAEKLIRDARAEDTGARTQYGVDYVIKREAGAAHKDIRYLETADDQISAISAAPESEALADLEKYLDTIDEDSRNDLFNRLVTAWHRGDANGMEALLQEEPMSPSVYDALLVDRNSNWTDKISELMEGKGQALIVVGAAHLIGKDSVPSMLKKKGFAVTRY
ncbi:MAG: TraB/GumN family protein [Geminicoccaceae bacterium]|nr:TraB/GumN family protein [Geminicoccaceae bacterium]